MGGIAEFRGVPHVSAQRRSPPSADVTGDYTATLIAILACAGFHGGSTEADLPPDDRIIEFVVPDISETRPSWVATRRSSFSSPTKPVATVSTDFDGHPLSLWSGLQVTAYSV